MKLIPFFYSTVILFLILSCGSTKKIDISTIDIDANWTVEHNPKQTIDSIIILNKGEIIKYTGDSVYSITTNAEKRRIDSLENFEKKQGYPINPFSPGEMTHQSFTLNENSNFSIVAYDTVEGNEVITFVEDRFPKGVYEVYLAIFSILKPGTYILAISTQLVDQYIKLEVN